MLLAERTGEGRDFLAWIRTHTVVTPARNETHV
jgi:hypothetical protein